METGIKKQIDNLNINIQAYIKCIDSLPEPLFQERIDSWTPRDITAHLIGWNLYTIKGCRQIKQGELPFYLNDPGDDFCKVNAFLVKEYDEKDRKKLIKQLKSSAKELKNYLSAVSPVDWETDFGVTFWGETITIKNSVGALIVDFANHRKQIEKWAEKLNL